MKKKILVLFVSAILIGIFVYYLKYSGGDQPTPLTTIVPVGGRNDSAEGGEKKQLNGDKPSGQESPGATGVKRDIPKDSTLGKQERFGYKEIPISNVDITFNVSSVVLPNQAGSNITGQADLCRFVDIITNDIHCVGVLLGKGDFIIREWNLSKKAIIDDQNNPVSWHVTFDGTNGTVSGVRKEVFTDNTHQCPLRDQGYYLTFYRSGYIVDQLGRNDGSEYILCFPNGQIRDYARKLENMSWYSIRWDKDGRVVSEKVEGPSPLVISSHKKLIEKYKNDPYKGEGIQQLEAELQAIQTNK